MSSPLTTLALRRLPRPSYPTAAAAAAAAARCRSKASMSAAAAAAAVACIARPSAPPLRHTAHVVPLRTCTGTPVGSSPPPLQSIAARARSLATSSATMGPTPRSTLDWDTFFRLRLRRRRIQLLFSVTTGLLGGAAGAVLLSAGMAEPLVMQVPLDPFVTLGLMTLACAGMGWLVGPSLGNQVFYLMNRRLKAQMMQKESEFFARVKKHRVDPSNSSAGNPVPDFYGEKIQSLSGYRQWLKDQRAFNKKKTRAFV